MVDQSDPREAARAEFEGLNKVIAWAIGVFGVGVADLVFGPMVSVLETWLGWLPTFALVAPTYALVNLLSCWWLLRFWDRWVLTESGRKLEQKVDRMRKKRLLERPVRWISRGSLLQFTLGSALVNAVASVVIVRLARHQRPPRLWVIIGSIAAGIWFAVLWGSIGAVFDAVLH